MAKTRAVSIQGEKSRPIAVKRQIARPLTSLARPFYRDGSIALFNEDFLNTQAISANSIDLIITSPPYNVDISYNSHDDKLPYHEYLKFTKLWLAKCYGLAKRDGRFCLNIPLDKNKGGHQSVYADITRAAKQVGWKYQCTIVWNEQNISRRTAWGSWMSASAPYVIAPVEMIAVFYKRQWKKISGSRSNNVTRDEFMAWTNGVWNFSGESKKRVGHPAPFPLELPRRCMKLFSFVGDTVLDPFLGSGTTLIACKSTDRAGIGFDIDKRYCCLAKLRIENTRPYLPAPDLGGTNALKTELHRTAEMVPCTDKRELEEL